MKSQTSPLKIVTLTFILFSLIIPFKGRCAPDTTAEKNAGGKTPASQTAAQTKKLFQPQESEVLDYQFDEISTEEKEATIKADYEVSLLISHPRDFLLQRPSDKSPLILYADGFPLQGMTTDYFSQLRKAGIMDSTQWWPDDETMWVGFIFKKDSTTKEAWNTLFRLAEWKDNHITVDLSLGWSGMYPLEVNKKADDKSYVTIVFYDKRAFWVLLISYLILIIFFGYLCNSTGLIREPDVVQDDNNVLKGPFSLSQTQLAFWTVIVIGGFIYLVLLTGLADCLNGSILLLLGISGGTTGVATFIDYYKKQPNAGNTQPMTPKKHRTFLLDILSDGVNVSMQRTQTVLWNLVLGGYFLWYVITNKAMPEFNSTLLVLAGVSSVLYLGSKGPENSTPPKPANPV